MNYTIMDIQKMAAATWSTNTFACNVPVTVSSVADKPAQKKGKPMCYDDYDSQPTVENRKLSFSQNRVSEIFYNHDRELQKMFHLNEDERPSTGEDLVARIKDGKYSLKDKESMKAMYIYNVFDYFIWRDPSMKKDEDGYTLARKELDTAHDNAETYVTLGDAKQAIEAINHFTNWQPTNAPKLKK